MNIKQMLINGYKQYSRLGNDEIVKDVNKLMNEHKHKLLKNGNVMFYNDDKAYIYEVENNLLDDITHRFFDDFKAINKGLLESVKFNSFKELFNKWLKDTII